MKKPREFWIEKAEGYYNDHDQIHTEKVEDSGVIHVIEMNAYEKLKEENESLKKQLEDIEVKKAVCCMQMEEENESLKAKLDETERRYRLAQSNYEAFSESCNLWQNSAIKYKDKLEIAVDALEFYSKQNIMATTTPCGTGIMKPLAREALEKINAKP